MSRSTPTAGMSLNFNSTLHPLPTLAGNGVKVGATTSATQRTPFGDDLAVIAADLQGNLTACNSAALDALGYEAGEIHGRPFTAFFCARSGTTQINKITTDESRGNATNAGLLETIVATVLADGQCKARCLVRPKSKQDFTADLCITLLRDSASLPFGMIALLSVVAEEAISPAPGKTQTQPAYQGEEEHDSPRTVSRDVGGSAFVLASPLMHQFLGMVERVAGHTETVLITGETGTGKELIAHTIHQSSSRRSRAWVDINCAALPENLVESELFGYEKGAFTGADASRPGLFERADKGTIFLDEIGELQLHTQVKLLRVLDGYPFYRLGGQRKIEVDVRVVAATNQDLESAVKEGRFREDLFHRLGQFQLRVPPLRERPEDVVALAEFFLGLKAPGSSFAPDAVSALLAHPWPGNVRELRNLIARVTVQASGPQIRAAQIEAAMSGTPSVRRPAAAIPMGNLDSMEEQMIIRALEKSGGHRGLAADALGISRRTLSRKLKEYNIDAARSGASPGALGLISLEQQKFFRARIQLPVTVKNEQGDIATVPGVNLSTGGLGLDGLQEPMRFSGLLDVSLLLPGTETTFRAKARIVWMGEEGRVGLRFAVIDPELFEQLQHWTSQKMKDEGWEVPA